MTSLLIQLATIIGFVFIFALAAADDSCYRDNFRITCYTENEKRAYRYYATKTDYKAATGLRDDDAEKIKIKGCQPVQIVYFGRHSARYPDKDDIVNMQQIFPKLRNDILQAHAQGNGTLCDDDLKALKKWKLQFSIKDENAVTKTGYKDTKRTAKRFEDRFPALFPDYDPKDYVFGITSRDRTNETLFAFLDGLFKKREIRTKVQFPNANDTLLSFHKVCQEIYKRTHDGKKRPKSEKVEKFRNSDIVARLQRNIARRLGVANIDVDTVLLGLKLCAHEFTAYGEDEAPWCAIFTKDDLQVLEFGADLDDYYGDAYGQEVNIRQTCPIIQDIVNRFEAARRNSSNVSKAVLYFSHAGAVKKLAAALGLFSGDQSLDASKYCELRDRNWRSSFVSPFNSNIALVLHRCNGNEYKIYTMLNEKEVILKGCSSSVCSLDDFLNTYSGEAANCNLEDICSK